MKQLITAAILAATAVTVQAETRTFANHTECIETRAALERSLNRASYSYNDKVYGDAYVLHKDGKVYAFTCKYAWSNKVEIDTDLEYLAKKHEVEKRMSVEAAKERSFQKELLKKLD